MRSFRVQVVIWIGTVVALAMLGISASVSALNMSRMSANIDNELVQRGRQMVKPFRQPGGPPFGNFRPGGPPQMQSQPGGTPRFGDEEADLIGSIRRPRWINPDGRIAGGFPGETIFDEVGLRRAKKDGPVFTEAMFRGMQIRVYTLPVTVDGSVETVIQIARELRDFNEIRRIQRETLAVFLPLGLVAAVIVAWFLTGRVIRPIAEMGKTTEAIGAGELSRRLVVSGDDEFAQLGRQFNQMADNVQGSIVQLEETLEQQRRFTADASHELRTPLTRMLMATSSALHGDEADFRTAVETSDAAARDMSKLVNQLLDLAQLESGGVAHTFEKLDLRLVVSESVTKTPRENPQIEVDLPQEPVFVLGNGDLLERACLNVLENARRHSPPESTIHVSLKTLGDIVEIVIIDQGEGVAPEQLGHLTERFYRIDSARSREAGGSGLGLSIVREIVESHGGSLSFVSHPGDGMKVTMILPLA